MGDCVGVVLQFDESCPSGSPTFPLAAANPSAFGREMSTGGLPARLLAASALCPLCAAMDWAVMFHYFLVSFGALLYMYFVL